MRKLWYAAIVPGVLVLIAVVLFVTLLLVKFMWVWTVPDLFPGAVRQGLIAGSISWFTAFKVALFVAVLAGIARGGHAEYKQKSE